MKKPNKVAIDGDLISYAAACGTETTYIIATNMLTNKKKKFKTRTELWGGGKEVGGWLAKYNEELDLKGITPLSKEDIAVEDFKDVGDVTHALHNVKRAIERNLKDCEVKDYKVVLELSESANFRDEIATILKYKDRTEEKPLHLKAVKEYLVRHHSCIVAEGQETDDVINILASSGEYIQATIDKDNYQSTGTWIYDWDKMDKPFYISDKGVGTMWLDSKVKNPKVRAYGFKSLCLQMLIGDTVDNIKPKHLAGKIRYGEKTVLKDMEGLKTHKDCLQFVVDKYKQWYPAPVQYNHWNTGQEMSKDWFGIASEMFLLLWMRRVENDPTTFKSLLDKYEVDYGNDK